MSLLKQLIANNLGTYCIIQGTQHIRPSGFVYNTVRANVQPELKLPSITASDLAKLNQPAGVSFSNLPKNEEQKEKIELRKFLTKFAIVVSSLVTTGLTTSYVFNKTKPMTDLMLKSCLRGVVPVAAAIGVATALSAAFQGIFDRKVDKEYLLNDVKDAFITSIMARSFTAITTKTGKFFSSFNALYKSGTLKRFAINGVIGSIYSALRGVVKPEKDDKLTLKNIATGFIEGIFLGEGARFIYKSKLGWSLVGKNSHLLKPVQYAKVVIGAGLGSMAYRVADYYTSRLFNSKDKVYEYAEKVKKHTLLEHLFRGNSYLTLIH